MNFTQLNWAAWFLIITQLLMVFISPTMIGRVKSNWSYSDFLGTVFGLIMMMFALRII